jgi:hypothetical protein
VREAEDTGSANALQELADRYESPMAGVCS